MEGKSKKGSSQIGRRHNRCCAIAILAMLPDTGVGASPRQGEPLTSLRDNLAP